MTFEEYLEQQLSKPDTEWFDPDGNSARAVVKRMKESNWKAYKWEWKPFWKSVKYFFTDDFDGFDTPIAWFVALPVNLVGILLFPLSMVIIAMHRHNRALEDYLQDYKLNCKENKEL